MAGWLAGCSAWRWSGMNVWGGELSNALFLAIAFPSHVGEPHAAKILAALCVDRHFESACFTTIVSNTETILSYSNKVSTLTTIE